MKKRILSFILCLSFFATMVLVAIPVSAAETMTMTALADSGNAAASGDVVTIASPDELDAFAKYVDNSKNTDGVTFKLLNDIVYNTGDASDYAEDSGLRTYATAGNYDIPFKGIFDGNNKTISGLYIKSADSYVGLIGSLGGATVQNLSIVNSYINTTAPGASAIAGAANAGDNIVSNVYVDATIKAAVGTSVTWGYTGGIVGLVQYASSIRIENVVVNGSIESRGSVGGIIGEVKANVTTKITNAVNFANVKGSTCVGGIVGYNQTSGADITSCITSGSITTQGFCGDIVGRNKDTSVAISNCAAVSNKYSSTTNYGGVCGGETKVDNTSYKCCTMVEEVEYVADAVTWDDEGWTKTYSECIIPTTVANMIKNAPGEIVAQATAANNEGKYSVRFLVSVDTLDYDAAALYIKATTNNETKEYFVNVTKAYTSVMACGETVNASTYGGKYLLAHAIEGIDVSGGDIVWTVQVITVANDVYNETQTVTFDKNIVAGGTEVKQ